MVHGVQLCLVRRSIHGAPLCLGHTQAARATVIDFEENPVGTLFTTLNPQFITLTMPEWIDMVAVVVGSAFGGLTASERKLDLFGAAGLGMLCGLGGGLIRDMIMQCGSVYMLSNDWAIPTAALAGTAVFFFSGLFKSLDKATAIVDILAVGIFTASGTDKAIIHELPVMAALLMGVLTGVGGGMLRDIFLGDVPQIFRPGNLYASCALISAAVYCALVYAGLVKGFAVVVCVAVCCLLRWLSLRFGITTPSPVDYTPRLIDYTRRLKHRTVSNPYIPYRGSRMGHSVRWDSSTGSFAPAPSSTDAAQQAREQRRDQMKEEIKQELREELGEELEAREREAAEGQAKGSAEAIFAPHEPAEKTLLMPQPSPKEETPPDPDDQLPYR